MSISDAHIIDEQHYTDLGDSGLPDWLINVADVITKNRKGGYITDALISQGLAKNPQALRQIFGANKAAINAYFEQIDLQALNQELGGKVVPIIETKARDLVKNNVPGLVVGLLVGATAISLFRHRHHHIEEAEND